MPTIAEIEFLPDADGRLLVFVYHEPPDAGLDTARLLRPGESFLGLSFEQLAAAGTGWIIPTARVAGGSRPGARMGAGAIGGAARVWHQ